MISNHSKSLALFFQWVSKSNLKGSELLRQVTQNFDGSLFRSLRFLELLKARSLHFGVIPFHFFCRKIGRPQFLTLLLLRHDIITLKKIMSWKIFVCEILVSSVAVVAEWMTLCSPVSHAPTPAGRITFTVRSPSELFGDPANLCPTVRASDPVTAPFLE